MKRVVFGGFLLVFIQSRDAGVETEKSCVDWITRLAVYGPGSRTLPLFTCRVPNLSLIGLETA